MKAKPKPEIGAIKRPSREAFLAALAVCGVPARACRAAGITRKTYYDWRAHPESGPEFIKACADAESEADDELEGKAMDLARAGDRQMLMFLLKTRRRAKYGDKVDVRP